VGRILAGVVLLAFGIVGGIVASRGGGNAPAARPAATTATTTAAPAPGPTFAVLPRPHHATLAPPKPKPKPKLRPKPKPKPEPACRPGAEQTLVTSRYAYSARVIGGAVAYRKPAHISLATFGRLNVNGYPTTFGVLAAVAGKGCKASWYRVSLPMRPNGIAGYVRASDVKLTRVATRIVVDLSARRVLLYRGGKRVIDSVAAIGTSATPTPTGRFYLNQKLYPSSPYGVFGPVALGVSAFSNVLQNWTQGGPIAIHGTNRPELLGQRITHGCIRLRNDVITQLDALAPAGTPVLIRA
jgi:lipoprotein-anchoring transpeptidase ErfK/SrfK